jgi:hypothetical protein
MVPLSAVVLHELEMLSAPTILSEAAFDPFVVRRHELKRAFAGAASVGCSGW